MSNFIIAVGHTASGNVWCGVVDRLDESNCTRAIGALVAEYLQEKGHGVNLLKIDGGCYAFNEGGRMYCDCVTADGWSVDMSGTWVRLF